MPEKIVKLKKRTVRRKLGFLARKRTRTGKAILKRRRLKGRKRI